MNTYVCTLILTYIHTLYYAYFKKISFHCKFDFMCAYMLTSICTCVVLPSSSLSYCFTPPLASLFLSYSPNLFSYPPSLPLHLLISPFSLSTYLLPLPSLNKVISLFFVHDRCFSYYTTWRATTYTLVNCKGWKK